jgi:hypothetical protein
VVADVKTVLERMVAAKISEERALQHIHAGSVRVDGEVITDPAAPCGTRIVIHPQSVTDDV